MVTALEIRDRVSDGLVTGRLWRLVHDRAKLQGATDGGEGCHVCDQMIPCGQAFALARASVVVLVHLECYLFWLHACGLFEPEPAICVSCRRLIPPHAEKSVVEDEAYHARCWERAADLVHDATGSAQQALRRRARATRSGHQAHRSPTFD
jgi:hypothetical protein